MHERRFGNLGKRLHTVVVSRRQPLKAVLAAMLAAGLSAVRPQGAGASRAKKRCAKIGGAWLPGDATSPCRCALSCSSTTPPLCHRNQTPTPCGCSETTEAEGFCAGGSSSLGGCTSSSDCPNEARCVIVPYGVGCSSPPTLCLSTTDCRQLSLGTGYACVAGTCQFTACFAPC